MADTIKSETEFTSAAGDVLSQLFLSGPIEAGDLVSKTGRNELIGLGLAHAANGWTILTPAGLQTALAVNLGEGKRLYDRAEQKQARDAKEQRDLLLRSISAIVRNAGGEVTLPQELVFSETGACLMDEPEPGFIRFRHYTEDKVGEALEAARVAAAARAEAGKEAA